MVEADFGRRYEPNLSQALAANLNDQGLTVGWRLFTALERLTEIGPMADAENRRINHRKSKELELTFHYGQEHSQVSTLDVSRSGALLKTHVMFPSGTLFILETVQENGDVPPIRLLARVARAAPSPRLSENRNGMGVQWVRAFSKGGADELLEFLKTHMGYGIEISSAIKLLPSGDAVFDFPPLASSMEPFTPTDRTPLAASYRTLRERFLSMLRGRFRVRVPVVYTVHNMHYRGTLIALGAEGLAVATQSAMPFPSSRVQVRYPIEYSDKAPRIGLFGETEMILEPVESDPGYFSVRIEGIDEHEHEGLFKLHLRQLAQKTRRW